MSRFSTRAAREAAYIEYVAARHAYMWRIAYGLTGDRHRADDLLQTALTKLYVAWPRVHGSGAVDAYVRTTLVRANIDESRRPWRREHLTDQTPDRAAAEDRTDERSALVQALQELPAMQRRCVILRHWLDLGVRETAAELGIAEGTVKSHTSRGLARLQQLMSDVGP